MKKILLVLSIFVFVGFFCIGCKKTPNEVSQNTEEEQQKIVAEQQDTEGKQQETEKEPSRPAAVPLKDLLIRPGIGVGEIKFGMTVQQMKDILGEPDVAATGISYMYSAYGIEVIAKDKKTISAIMCGNPHGQNLPEIKAMEKACKFKTVEGIGIGSTEDQVLEAFGQPTMHRGDILRYRKKRMAITLADDKVIGMWIQ